MFPESIAHYRIIKKLRAGGMGEVYLALDSELDRKVAIKVLPPDSLAEENLEKRRLREAQAAAKLDHPNICAVFDVNEADSLSYFQASAIADYDARAGMSRGFAVAQCGKALPFRRALINQNRGYASNVAAEL